MPDDFSILQNYTLFVYTTWSVHFTCFGDLLFTFYKVEVVDRDLTKFQDCFFHVRDSACKPHVKIIF